MRPRTAGNLLPAVFAIVSGLYFGPGIAQGASAAPTAPATPRPAPVAWQAATPVGSAPTGAANQWRSKRRPSERAWDGRRSSSAA